MTDDVIYNPLEARRGDFLTVDEPRVPQVADLAARTLTVDEITEYSRFLDGRPYRFTDYVCEDGDCWATVRVYPKVGTGLDYVCLRPDREMEYDAAFHRQVLPVGVLEVRQDNVIIATYDRVNGVKAPYKATIRALGKDGLENDELWYWDYGRTLPGGGTEFYFVEMNSKTGWFQMYLGYPVAAAAVTLLPKG